MNQSKPKVLFIAGNGRSGSTILHNILGQIDGFFAIGEVRHIWDRGLLKNRLCGCGVPFHDCAVWDTILTAAYGGADRVDAEKMFALTESFRIQNLPLTAIPRVRNSHLIRLHGYLDALSTLYGAIQSTTGSRVIVDSSKNPSYGYLLRMIPNIDLYILHFVRDSQAVAYSWSKKKQFQPGDYMARKPPVKSALQWNARNISAEMYLRRKTARYLLLRYEDFVRAPQQSVESIVGLVGEQDVTLPFVTADTVALTRATHSVFGNEVRFQNGFVKVTLDTRWQNEMSRKQKFMVTALTWPLRLKYGYVT